MHGVIGVGVVLPSVLWLPCYTAYGVVGIGIMLPSVLQLPYRTMHGVIGVSVMPVALIMLGVVSWAPLSCHVGVAAAVIEICGAVVATTMVHEDDWTATEEVSKKRKRSIQVENKPV